MRHEEWRDFVVGEHSPLLHWQPQVALALLCTYPAGSQDFVDVRDDIANVMFGPGWAPVLSSVATTLVHHPVIDLPLGPDEVYIGRGWSNGPLRPSPWANPFPMDGSDPSSTSLQMFTRYAASRCDGDTWLAPLVGKRCMRVAYGEGEGRSRSGPTSIQ